MRFQARFAPQPDRPGPQSQSFSRSYGSDLPTSLTYIVLSARGCSPWRPAADMGTTRHENQAVSLGFSRAGGSAPDTARAAALYGAAAPISGRADSRVSAPYQEKRTLPGAPADVSEFVCVAAPAAQRQRSPCPGSGILTRFPFEESEGAAIAPASERSSPISQGRLTHVQLLFTWNPSPLRPSRFSLEYLLLPPRSAPAAAPRGLAPGASALTAAALLLAAAYPGERLSPTAAAAGYGLAGRSSAIHFQG